MVSRCFPGGYNVKLYISRGRLAWWLLAFLCCAPSPCAHVSWVHVCMHEDENCSGSRVFPAEPEHVVEFGTLISLSSLYLSYLFYAYKALDGRLNF